MPPQAGVKVNIIGNETHGQRRTRRLVCGTSATNAEPQPQCEAPGKPTLRAPPQMTCVLQRPQCPPGTWFYQQGYTRLISAL